MPEDGTGVGDEAAPGNAQPAVPSAAAPTAIPRSRSRREMRAIASLVLIECSFRISVRMMVGAFLTEYPPQLGMVMASRSGVARSPWPLASVSASLSPWDAALAGAWVVRWGRAMA
jgi:hypothetical protein